jgi:hypothetical protein
MVYKMAVLDIPWDTMDRALNIGNNQGQVKGINLK